MLRRALVSLFVSAAVNGGGPTPVQAAEPSAAAPFSQQIILQCPAPASSARPEVEGSAVAPLAPDLPESVDVGRRTVAVRAGISSGVATSLDSQKAHFSVGAEAELTLWRFVGLELQGMMGLGKLTYTSSARAPREASGFVKAQLPLESAILTVTPKAGVGAAIAGGERRGQGPAALLGLEVELLRFLSLAAEYETGLSAWVRQRQEAPVAVHASALSREPLPEHYVDDYVEPGDGRYRGATGRQRHEKLQLRGTLRVTGETETGLQLNRYGGARGGVGFVSVFFGYRF